MDYLIAGLFVLGSTGLLILAMQIVWNSDRRLIRVEENSKNPLLGIWVSKRNGRTVQVRKVLENGEVYVVDEAGGGNMKIGVLFNYYEKL